jgi:hypothetical protein
MLTRPGSAVLVFPNETKPFGMFSRMYLALYEGRAVALTMRHDEDLWDFMVSWSSD